MVTIGLDTYELPLRWDGAGVAESTWTIPKTARLGQYDVVMAVEHRRSTVSATFQVQDFRVPRMNPEERAE